MRNPIRCVSIRHFLDVVRWFFDDYSSFNLIFVDQPIYKPNFVSLITIKSKRMSQDWTIFIGFLQYLGAKLELLTCW